MRITQSNIAELLNQSSCSYPCQAQPKPGLSQGGCAFDGAWIAMQPIADVAHLVHGPITCVGNVWETRSSLSSGEDLHTIRFTTDIGEKDVIFGGAQRLYQAILNIAKGYQPAAVFVYNTCTPALVGDDLKAICKAASAKIGLPVIPINSPGFIGSQHFGSRIAAASLLEYVIGSAEPEYTTPGDINLIGDDNIAGKLWGVLPLFRKLGIRVLSKITGDVCYREICYAHRAQLNIITSSKTPVSIAQKMEKRYGIPYLEESFYGIENINRCLRNIAAKIGDADLKERTEQLIAEETSQLQVALAPYRARLQGKRIVVYTSDVKSWSIILTAQELGMEVVVASIWKSTEEDKTQLCDLINPETITLDWVGVKDLVQVIKKTKADLLVGSGHSQYAALKASIPFLDINHKHHYPYTGYVGAIAIARELDKTLYSPVWTQLQRPLPWRSSEVTYQDSVDFGFFGYQYEADIDDVDDGTDC